MKTIHLKLHKEANSLMLDFQDVYDYIGEEKAEDLEIAYYISKWCDYLNWFVGGMHNTEMKFADADYANLQGWLDGYNYAKKYEVTETKSRTEIKTKKYLIVLDTPFDI